MECGYTKWRWQDTYNLTVEGWTEGMVLLERHNQPEFEAKLQKLMGTLKDQIKGRDDDEAYLPLEQASAESGVSQELIRNILEGRYIEKVLGRIGARLDTDQVIVIPRRFGQAASLGANLRLYILNASPPKPNANPPGLIDAVDELLLFPSSAPPPGRFRACQIETDRSDLGPYIPYHFS